MFPVFLINLDQGCYYKINTADGDGLVIDYCSVSIRVLEKGQLFSIASMTSLQRVIEGYVPLDKEHFYEIHEKVQNVINKQLIFK